MLNLSLQHSLGNFTIDVQFRVEEGQVMTLIGPSGSGKTMTLRLISGLLRPDTGFLKLGGTTLHSSSDGTWVAPHARNIGYVPQHYALFPHLTVRENVAFGVSGDSKGERNRITETALETFRISDVADRLPRSLSGGQQQRVALGRALAAEPRALLLDEPLAALDHPLRRELRRELNEIKERAHIPIVLVTHDFSDAIDMADVAILLENGHVVDEGRPSDVIHRPPRRSPPKLNQVENILPGRVIAVSQEDGTMTCGLGPVSLVVPNAGLQVRDEIRIGIRAEDVLIGVELPVGLIVENILPGIISAISENKFECQITVNCTGLDFRADVTARTVSDLALQEGQAVWLVIKNNSCFVLE